MKALESNPGLSLFVRRRFLCWGRRQRPTRVEARIRLCRCARGGAGGQAGHGRAGGAWPCPPRQKARGAKPLAGGGQGCERAPRMRSWSLPGIMKALRSNPGLSLFCLEPYLRWDGGADLLGLSAHPAFPVGARATAGFAGPRLYCYGAAAPHVGPPLLRRLMRALAKLSTGRGSQIVFR